jgi:hypothetical protein
VNQVRCTNCRKRQRAEYITIREKPCKRCGEIFTPRSNHYKLCERCSYDSTLKVKMAFNPQNPCSGCRFLDRCRELVKHSETWPLCWAASPERDEFIQAYQGEKTFQGQLATTLLAAIELEVMR